MRNNKPDSCALPMVYALKEIEVAVHELLDVYLHYALQEELAPGKQDRGLVVFCFDIDCVETRLRKQCRSHWKRTNVPLVLRFSSRLLAFSRFPWHLLC